LKVVMINDCAFVAETLIKFFPPELKVQHLKRSRSLWSKTFGVAWKIIRAEADIFHANYLLQDCYLASRFGKQPLIGHAHGSDLRVSLKHRLWGRIVRHNLEHCARILVSTPDLLGIAKRFRSDAEYLPNPVDTGVYYFRPLSQRDEKLKVLIASGCDWELKGTDIAVRALGRLKGDVKISIIRYGKDFDATVALAKSLGLHLNVLRKVSHQDLREYYWNADVVVDQFTYGVIGMITLEAIACGRPVVTHVSTKYPEYKGFPMKDLMEEEEIARAISCANYRLWEEENVYLTLNHQPEDVSGRLLKIYETLT
jgi:glycosyltransferase involved in cell wall biosynthesis